MSADLRAWQRSTIRNTMADYRRAQEDQYGCGEPLLQLAPAQIAGTVIAMAHQIRNQYMMGFVPQGPFDGSYRRLRVEAKGRERLTVRTRPGYRATPDSVSHR